MESTIEIDSEVGKQQDKNKPHTFLLFSPLKTQKLSCFAFPVFSASEIVSTPFKSKRRKTRGNFSSFFFKKNKGKVGMEWDEREEGPHLMAYIPPT